MSEAITIKIHYSHSAGTRRSSKFIILFSLKCCNFRSRVIFKQILFREKKINYQAFCLKEGIYCLSIFFLAFKL